MQVRLYSDYPWKFRKDGGPADDFERDALRRLRENPDDPVYEFTEYQGRPVLRYAIARRLRQSCLNCHNYDKNSPKLDWKVGEVRGVVEIIRPLDRDAARARAGLRDTFILVAVVCGSLLLATLAVVLFRAPPRADNRKGRMSTIEAVGLGSLARVAHSNELSSGQMRMVPVERV